MIIINPFERRGIVFDTETREFSDIFMFGAHRQSGFGSSCIMIGDFLHILHGVQNSDYIIRSMTDETARKFEVEPEQNLYDAAVIKSNGCYQSSSNMLISGFIRHQSPRHVPSVLVDIVSEFCIFELFKFGGWNANEQRDSDSFYIGTLRNGNPAEPVEWKLAPQFALNYPMVAFGFIHHGPFIVTFGGATQDSDSKQVSRTNSIYILDLRRNCGWIESPMKCPPRLTHRYDAVLDESNRVHLNERYWIDLKDILPQICNDPF